MKGKLLILLTILLLPIACNFQEKKTYMENEAKPLLPPLDSGVVDYHDKLPFDTLFHLTGEKVPLSDSLLKEVEYISIKDGKVVLHKNYTNGPVKFPVGNNEFIYVKDSFIIHTTIYEDSIVDRKIHRLTMFPSSGTLIVDTSKNRMVFAYSYYHIIQVMDLEAKKVKTIDFEGGKYTYKFITIMDAPDPNIIYYIDAFAGENYFYLLYWGHSSSELFNNAYKGWQETRNGKYVKTADYKQNLQNIVEQYDWNGNPVGRYLLEGDPGYFVVNEKTQQFYLLASECYGYTPFMAFLVCNKSIIAYQFNKRFQEVIERWKKSQ